MVPPRKFTSEAALHLHFAAQGNAGEMCGDGWSGPEPRLRWMTGAASTLVLADPPADPGTLFVKLRAFRNRQRLAVRVDGVEIGSACITYPLPAWYGFRWPGGDAAASQALVEFVHPDCGRPCDDDPNNRDSRELALCAFEMAILPGAPFDDAKPQELARVPAPQDAARRKALALEFESLGENCEFGLFQRRCGAEPIGPFRFASLPLPRLVDGLECAFADLGNDQLNVVRNARLEWQGHHETYGLAYHTFNCDEQLPAGYVERERKRLAYLARLLVEQLAGAEKIWVIQRRDLDVEQVLAVLKVLRMYSARNRLLWVTLADDPVLAGRVELLDAGCCHGFIDRLAPGDNAHDLSFDGWLGLCAAAAQAMA